MGRGACVVAQGDYWAGLKGRQAFARRMRRRACCAKCKSRGQGLPAHTGGVRTAPVSRSVGSRGVLLLLFPST